MVRYPALFILVTFCTIFQIEAAIYPPQPDSSNCDDTVTADLESTFFIEQDSLIFKATQADDPVNPLIFDMLDSLVSLRFFSNNSFPEDTSVLNILNYSPEDVPVFSDSVLQARIEKLNQTSLIEISYNKYVKSYLEVYAVRKRGLASRILGLAEVYFPLFEEQLDKYNLPLELKYLAVVESALNPVANSRAGAKGLWQFMYNTGKLYGLKANSLVDDRFDPYKATDAACRHLKDLYNIYGDWSLVLAAYNSGAGNVNKAIRRAGGVKNYWAIWPYLPRETRGYVPAFVAVMYLMNYPSEHNLYPARPMLFFEQIDTVMINDALSFNQVSEYLKVSEDELKFLNPAYKNGIIPASKESPYILRLDYRYIPSFVEYEQEIYAYKTKKGIEKEKLLVEIKNAKEQYIHVVRSGESLGVIAKKYHCSVNSIKSWNNLRSNMIHPGQKLVVNGNGTQSENNASKTKSNSKPVEDKKPEAIVKEPEKVQDNIITSEDYIYHIVRKGDTLWDIARQYEGVTVEQIKQLNNITNTKNLKPGQKLKVGKKG